MDIMRLLFLCIISACSMVWATNMPQQTPYKVLNVQGYVIDPITGKIDDTEGFGAFDYIMQYFKPTCPNNFDNGGGAFDATTVYVKNTYDIENVVYDPFMRHQEHNERVLELARQKPFDCCTSLSVLNVIDAYQARFDHIMLCYQVVKENGTVFFKVWPGNDTGIAIKDQCSFQSNKNATYYVDEIKVVFGDQNVALIDAKTIKAIKK